MRFAFWRKVSGIWMISRVLEICHRISSTECQNFYQTYIGCLGAMRLGSERLRAMLRWGIQQPRAYRGCKRFLGKSLELRVMGGGLSILGLRRNYAPTINKWWCRLERKSVCELSDIMNEGT